jgi:GAF domain-containing protein
MLGLDGETVAAIVANLPRQVEAIADLLDILIDDLRFHPPADAAGGDGPRQNDRLACTRSLLEITLEIHETAGRGLDLSALVDYLVPRLVHTLGLADVVLFFPDGGFTVLRARYGYGEQATRVIGTLAVPLSRDGDVAVEAFCSREPVMIDEDHPADSWSPPDGSLMAVLRGAKVAAVPIGYRDRVLGVLLVSRFPGGRFFSPDELRVILMFAGEVARHLMQRGASA